MVLIVDWNYQLQHTEELHLKNFEITYTISINDVEITHTSSTLSDSQQRSVNLTISRVNIYSGTYIVKLNVTTSNAQSSLSVICPSLILGKSVDAVL